MIARAAATGFAIVVASGTVAGRAGADEMRECATAYEQTQRLQQKSQLVAALEAAERCARPTCPDLLKNECAQWSKEIQSKIPKLVVHVRDGEGCDRTDAKIEVAGASRKEGDTLLVDPGRHEIVVTDPVSSGSKTHSIDFAPGERREIDVVFATDGAVCGGPSAPKPSGQRIPKLTLVLGGVGGGLVLAGATLGAIGAIKTNDLDECKPNCSQERIDGVRPFFVAGDVIAGFGVLLLGAAVITYLSDDGKSAASSRPRLVIDARGVGATF
jgi:hypothetical protein